MVYPFLLMASTGMKGPTDQNDNRLIPSFLNNQYELFRKYVDDKYYGRIELAAPFYGTENATRLMSSTESDPIDYPKLHETSRKQLEQFLLELPLDQWEVGFRTSPGRLSSRLAMFYQDWLRTRYPSIQDLNKAYIEQHVVFQTVQPPVEKFATRNWSPTNDRRWQDWLEFKKTLPAEFRIPITLKSQWQSHVRSLYRNTFDAVPISIRKNAKDFSYLEPDESLEAYRIFLKEIVPQRFRKNSPDHKWFNLTGQKSIPLSTFDYTQVVTRPNELKFEYSSRNYRFVLDYILIHGRAVINTVIFCALAILTALFVNPLAAYALSRFNLPSTGKILLFLLATMAFPAEVTLIPSFLLLRDLGLLNTFAALVLPTAANGYSIYLLKGFFDSLPKDLYESASLDGAKEWTMFTKITIPLSKPVLAVIALTSFMGAYGAFIYAFLIAQNEKMWTLMVWIYQLQMRAPKATVMAALAIAAVPTLIIFLLAQRVILRGIILPGEK